MTRIRSFLLRAGSVWAMLQRTALRWLVALVGRWEWQAPAWLAWVRRQSVRGWRHTTATRARAATLAAVVIAVAGAGVWWFTRPTPHYVSYSVTPPGLTEYDDNGISSIKPLRIVFSESVAPLGQMQKAVTRGLTMSPSVAGQWFWTADKELQFTPKDDWPVDGAFSVQFARQWVFRQRSRARELSICRQERAFLGRHRRESVLPGSPRPQPEEAGRDLEVHTPRRHGTTRVARLACGRQGCRISGTGAGQPPLHRGLRQVQVGRLRPLRRVGDAARRHADDAHDRSRRAGGSRWKRYAQPAAVCRHDPRPHQPSLL